MSGEPDLCSVCASTLVTIFLSSSTCRTWHTPLQPAQPHLSALPPPLHSLQGLLPVPGGQQAGVLHPAGRHHPLHHLLPVVTHLKNTVRSG